MPYLGTFGQELIKTIIIFEIATLKFVKNESLTQTVNFGIGSAFLKVWVRVRVCFIKYAPFKVMKYFTCQKINLFSVC